ncbi:EBNA-1 nuclear protein [Erythrobacter sp. AP23]|nr:EBNA-1 nuclear protein [Erythrobacter sp. AP23]
MSAKSIREPYLLFLGDGGDIKTATGVHYWRPDICIGQMRLSGQAADLGLEELGIAAAANAGVGTLIVGVATIGGHVPETWIDVLAEALEAGLDLASGLHLKLQDIPRLREIARANGRRIHDVRHPTQDFAIPSFEFRPGKRLLTVGTDCAVGKMFTSLAIEREMKAQGLKTTFRATGQTGILIEGSGISIDAVVSDFISSATAWLAPANDPDHWDIIEGQGSLFHPAFAGVTLGLVHGSQPDLMVLCGNPSLTHLRYFENFKQPSLEQCIERYEEAARLTNPNAKIAGISLNTSQMGEVEAHRIIEETRNRLGMPCFDPVRTGVSEFVSKVFFN